MSQSINTTAEKPSLKTLLSPLEGGLRRVKDSLKAIIPPTSEMLEETVRHSLNSGGKFMRPAIALLCGGATGDVNEHHVEVAAVSEMIHIATLLHDDVLDEADMRRGKETVRNQHGNKVSILSGDFLLAQASLKLSKLGNTRLVAIYAQVLADLCDGEVIQMNNSYHLETPIETLWEQYFRKTYCKTASLFAAACESAAVINQLPEAQIQQLRDYGCHVGNAFQMIDDLLDYTSTAEKMGKPVLDDLRNGHLNAPILLALNDNSPLSQDQQVVLRNLITQVFEEPDNNSHREQILVLLSDNGILEAAKIQADEHVEKAKSALSFISDNPDKTRLSELADFICQRDF